MVGDQQNSPDVFDLEDIQQRVVELRQASVGYAALAQIVPDPNISVVWSQWSTRAQQEAATLDSVVRGAAVGHRVTT